MARERDDPTAVLHFPGAAGAQELTVRRFARELVAWTPAEVPAVLARAEEECRAGAYAVGFVAYEAAAAFDRAMRTHAPLPGLPLAYFGIAAAAQVVVCSADEGGAGAGFAGETGAVAGGIAWTAAWDEQQYERACARALAEIQAGEMYQVNLTFPLRVSSAADSRSIYQSLRQAQAAEYTGWLRAGAHTIISLSPELFFARTGRRMLTRPMKGTAPRGRSAEEDRAAGAALAADAKNGAENLMIVDLLRNDLGRLARPGSVQVPHLLRAARYPTLWQMTSDVTAELAGAVGLDEIFRALFPCGSVTGAPKVRAMQAIRELEDGPRGVYCGAFGVIRPGGDCVFNVPIRTLLWRAGGAEAGTGVYGAGSGIVADSQPRAEYAECLLKARVLDGAADGRDVRRLADGVRLLETLLWTPEGGYAYLAGHLARLRDSAEYFGVPYDDAAVRKVLAQIAADGAGALRVRLLVDGAGAAQAQSFAFAPMPAEPVTVRLAQTPVDSRALWLYHKTTDRSRYEEKRREVEAAGGEKPFEVLLVNERGELTEGTFCNLALHLDGAWRTPPVRCGLLPGVLRAELLRTGALGEQVLRPADLARAAGLCLFNSLRGILPAQLPGNRAAPSAAAPPALPSLA